MFYEWIFVGIAIIAEVIAALALRFSLGFSKPWPALLALVSFASAFYAVSLALVSLPVSVVYPIWAGGGTAGVAFLGVVALHEKYNIWKGIGVLMVVAGIVVLNLEESVGSRKSTQALDAPGKFKNLLITNKVTTQFLNHHAHQNFNERTNSYLVIAY